jgi:RNA polymerase sigma-70 factor, ECF subfamily
MSDPYTPSRAPRADPGPTPSYLLSLLDGTAGATAPHRSSDWNRYAAWLFSVCLRRRVQEGDAQDAVQEVLAALGHFPRFRRAHPGATLRAWMVGVLAHKLGDQGRERARRPEAIPDDRLDVASVVRPVDPGSAGDEAPGPSAYAPILDRVRRRCAEPKNWLAFRGAVLEGKSAPEVAAELGMDLADVHTARSRGLRRLREEIGAEAAPLRSEFDERTWSLFLESAVAGAHPEVVARRRGLPEVEVDAAVARVLRRFRQWLRDRS